jgi:dTMP kinase
MLITFEGIDGSGKSTQAGFLKFHLESMHHREVRLVHEPGSTAVSERIRSLLLDPTAHIVPFAELLLFSAARAQLVNEILRPSLEAGMIVICDRFYDSTTAYQGSGREMADLEWMQGFHHRVTGGLIPDRTYFVDVPVDVAAERRGGDRDRMEQAGVEFFERVRQAYLDLAEREPERVIRIDGTRTTDEINAEVVTDVERLLARREAGTATGSPG